jgi:hypothetical protein
MLKPGHAHRLEREKALADGLRDVAAELRLIDATDLVAFLRTGQFGNIANLVNSSTELYFKPGTLAFGLSGDVELKWGETPAVALDMEFNHQGVTVYFRLLLQALQAGVDITYITFADNSSNPEANTARLIDAISAARLSPIPHHRLPASALTAT